MMTIATWRSGISVFKADAQKVADEIFTIGEEVTPAQILDKARDDSTELHKCFEWDDTAAAEKYRLYQARQIVSHLVFAKPDDAPADTAPIRVFHKTEASEGYKPFEVIIANEDEHQKLLQRAWNELRSFKRKYESLSTELEEIFKLIA